MYIKHFPTVTVQLSGKNGPKDQVALHYYYILRLRIGARLTRYQNCKFHNFARTISRHADGISRYSVPPSAGPLLPLVQLHNFDLFRTCRTSISELGKISVETTHRAVLRR